MIFQVISPSSASCLTGSGWIPVTYNSVSLQQTDALKQRSTYCYQDLHVKCRSGATSFPLSSVPGWFDRYNEQRSFTGSIGKDITIMIQSKTQTDYIYAYGITQIVECSDKMKDKYMFMALIVSQYNIVQNRT